VSDEEPLWMPRARREIGIKEIPGPGDHPRVLEYHAATKLHAKADEVPWCSAFVCWVFEGIDIASTRSAAARSWLKWGKPLDKPQIGCVVVFSRTSPDNPNAAHVAFYAGERDGKVLALGGNQRNSVCIRPYDADRVLGYRWPDL
jgi:uncharacterized protein (TIGR02594 family)